MLTPIYKPNKNAGKTLLFPGFELWNEIAFEIDDYHSYDVSGTIRLHGERLEMDELTVKRRDNAEQITGYGIREITPAAIIRNSLRIQAPTERRVSVAFGLLAPEDPAIAKAAGPTDQTLAMVAKVYRASTAVQYPAAKAVQELFNLSARTAGSWIAKAKAKGLIPTGDNNAPA